MSSSCEELPVNEVISRVHYIFSLRHRSLVGLCERMPSKSYIGRGIEFLMCGAQGLSDALLSGPSCTPRQDADRSRRLAQPYSTTKSNCLNSLLAAPVPSCLALLFYGLVLSTPGVVRVRQTARWSQNKFSVYSQ